MKINVIIYSVAALSVTDPETSPPFEWKYLDFILADAQ